MKELGEKSLGFHLQVGQMTKELGLDGVFVLVDDGEAEAIAQGSAPLKAECFSTHADLTQRLQDFIQPGDTVLFKASRSVKLDLVVDQLRELFAGESLAWLRGSPPAPLQKGGE
jgi:UDP-N-acetylmuramoyl-tripeptide--D-alanyl-D-alanine ligase